MNDVHNDASSSISCAYTMPDTLELNPLRMALHAAPVHELTAYLARARSRMMANPQDEHTLAFSQAQLALVRESFNHGIRQGESVLHRVCKRLTDSLMEGQCERQSVVVCEVAETGERMRIEHAIREEALYGQTDLALGQSVLERMRMIVNDTFVEPRLVANYVEYLPLVLSEPLVHRISSRIKAEEEIWNKVVDEIFDLDGIVSRDKQLSQYSRYVKDIFGVKIVVGSDPDARRVHDWLVSACRSGGVLYRLDVHDVPTETVETKDYLHDNGKNSGWGALKSVFLISGKTVEIQVQTLENNTLELQRLTTQSHSAFKQRREQVRDEVARTIPLFGYYRELLRWMFQSPGTVAPCLSGIRVVIED